MAYEPDVAQRVNMLRQHYIHRDSVASQVLHVRRGDWDKVDPDAFSEQYPRPIVANVIDEQARHATAALSPMPMIRCRASVNSASQRAKDRADKRTKIVNHYFDSSRVEYQMQDGADQFYTFGMIVAEIVPDFERQMPEIRVRRAQHVYPVWDSLGRTVEVAQVFEKRAVDLRAQYPEAADAIKRHADQNGRTSYEVFRHDNGKQVTILIPSIGEGLVLHQMENPIGRCLTVCVPKHTVDGYIRGAFDDLIWAQLARNEVQMLTLEGIRDAIEAPFVLPTDVANVAIGPKAVIRTNNPQGARRLPMEVTPQAMAAVEHFESEMHKGAISPPALGGSIDASVVTGKGVQEMMAGYSQQIAMDQQTLMGFFREAATVCILMDMALWADVTKKCEGVKNGSDYDFTYTPEKDLEGKTEVDVNYGTSTGMNPNQHVVYLLQLMSGGLYSKDTVLRELPGSIDATQELSKVAVEASREALLSAVQGLAQSVASLAANGAPPEMVSEVVFKVAMFTDAMEKGEQIEAVAKKIFAPPEPVEQPAPTAEAAVAEGAPPEDALAALMGGGGGPEGGGGPVEAQPPDPTGDLSTFFGNLQGGGANLQASGKIKRHF